ncbi:sensor histidine kinase [Cohnella nanjingensis]|uniref:histidine kinase n=2 Tax=Cohnella nanjingensis TaxID=1387779 RepID=A0A7X0RTT0_9BACL|nr:sensor histidine kinase [Cohnella nanjingensis]
MLYSYYARSASILEQEVSRSMQQTLKQAGNNLAYRLERAQDVSNSVFMNPNLHRYLGGLNDGTSIGEQLDNIKYLRSWLESLQANPLQANSDVFRVRLFVDKSRLFANEQINFFPMDGLKTKSWYSRIMEANGGMVWTGIYEERYTDRTDSVSILSCARMLRDPAHYDQILGVLMIDVEDKTVMDILADLGFTKPNRAYLVDSEGVLIAHTDRSLIGTRARPGVLEALQGEDEGGVKKIVVNDGTEYVVSTSIGPTSWKLVAEVPAAEISRRAVAQSRFSGIATLLGFLGLFLLLAFMLLTFIVRSINHRMKQVVGIIRKEGLESLDELQPSPDGDFRLLERSVDRLVHKVRSLVEETYKARMLEREAQLRALQAQINPHFLYNTLDTINWFAIGRGAADISQMIDALAKYFRLSLNKGRDLVSVEDELNLARVYLDIQFSRFPGSFDFTIESDPGLGMYIMPKLTLQPIVENALLHGIRKTKDKRGTIRIAARRDGDDLELSVTDDGIGMEEDRAQRLLREPPSSTRSDGSGSSYGLYNVNERIALFAGDSYGLRIRSRPGAGTTVTVRLKAVAQANEGQA